MRKLILSLVLLVLGFACAAAQSVTQPPQGSRLRKELLDAARTVFERETDGPVEFVVHRLNAMGGWAFGDVFLRRPGGRGIDWSKTKFAEAEKNGAFDPGGSFFLLKQSGSNWTVVEFATGPTDVAWDSWRQDRHLPSQLFERDLR
jgi:opacity protein-like surface antigen